MKTYLLHERQDWVEGNDKKNRENLESVLYSKHIDVLREDTEKEASKKPNFNEWPAKSEKSWMALDFEAWLWCQNLTQEKLD